MGTPTLPTPVFIDANGNFVVNEAAMLDKKETVTTFSYNGNVIVTGIPEWYCATMYGATCFKTWLKTNGITVTIVMRWPVYQNQAQSSMVVQSEEVPWLDDGKGAVEEAGQLLYNFVNLPYSIAENTALQAFALDDTQQNQ